MTKTPIHYIPNYINHLLLVSFIYPIISTTCYFWYIKLSSYLLCSVLYTFWEVGTPVTLPHLIFLITKTCERVYCNFQTILSHLIKSCDVKPTHAGTSKPAYSNHNFGLKAYKHTAFNLNRKCFLMWMLFLEHTLYQMAKCTPYRFHLLISGWYTVLQRTWSGIYQTYLIYLYGIVKRTISWVQFILVKVVCMCQVDRRSALPVVIWLIDQMWHARLTFGTVYLCLFDLIWFVQIWFDLTWFGECDYCSGDIFSHTCWYWLYMAQFWLYVRSNKNRTQS